MAIAWSVQLQQPYPENQWSKIKTDQDTLKWILTPADSTGQLAHLCFSKMELRFNTIDLAKIEHQPGDILLRLPTADKYVSILREEISRLAVDQVVNANTADTTEKENKRCVSSIETAEETTDQATYYSSTLVKLISALKHNLSYRTTTAQAAYANSFFSIISNWPHLRRSAVYGGTKIVLPPSLPLPVLTVSHQSQIFGHP